MRRLVRFLRSLLQRDRVEADMADEMAFHLQARADALAAESLSREEALRRARLEFGAPDRYKEECRESLGLRLVDELRADLRFAVRQLLRARAFSLATILILAVAIGAGTALFSTADAVLLRLLPVDRPEELRRLAWVDGERSGFMGSYEGSMHAWPSGRLAIYGTLAYQVSRRRPEIGLRMAFGARAGHVVRLVVREAALPTALGLAMGLAASFAAGRLVESLLFGTSPRDPAAFAGAGIALALCAALAAALPAWRATRIAPMRALRQD